MPRSKSIKRRKLEPDPLYNSLLVARIINRSMTDGKKSVAMQNIYKALELVEKKSKQKAIEALEDAIKNITPQMEVRSRRVGGAAYQVPMPVKTHRGATLAVRWLVIEANKRSNKEYHTFAEKMAAEILDALEEAGGAVQKKVNAHKMAEANKAFAHFRW